MSYRRSRATQPPEPWEQLEDLMRKPTRPKPNTELIDAAPRDVPSLMQLGAARLNRLADELRISPKPDGLVPQKEHPRMWRERASFLSKTDHEKARLVSVALRAYDLKP